MYVAISQGCKEEYNDETGCLVKAWNYNISLVL